VTGHRPARTTSESEGQAKVNDQSVILDPGASFAAKLFSAFLPILFSASVRPGFFFKALVTARLEAACNLDAFRHL
jgi:hypothetical protein